MIIKRPGAAKLLGDKTAMDAHHRKTMRELLPDLLANWEPWEAWIEPDGTAYVARYGDHENPIKFKPKDLSAALSVEHYQLFRTLFELLQEQSRVALWAVNVAKMEFGTQAKRVDAAAKSAIKKKRAAKARETTLLAEARKLRTSNPRLSAVDVGRLLSERGHGSAQVIRKKLPKRLRQIVGRTGKR